MTNPFNYKKEYKDLYSPKTKPSMIDVPKMVFIMVDGMTWNKEMEGKTHYI